MPSLVSGRLHGFPGLPIHSLSSFTFVSFTLPPLIACSSRPPISFTQSAATFLAIRDTKEEDEVFLQHQDLPEYKEFDELQAFAIRSRMLDSDMPGCFGIRELYHFQVDKFVLVLEISELPVLHRSVSGRSEHPPRY